MYGKATGKWSASIKGVILLLSLFQSSSAMVVFRVARSTLNSSITALTRDDIIAEANTAQNCYRAKHQANALALDPQISQASQSWADTMAASDNFEHSGSSYGENLFAATGSIQNGGVPIYYWYKEWQDVNYDFSLNSGQGAGHFTQLVWKASARAGFGVASSATWTYFVANYDPPGNDGNYVQNVGPPSDDNINSCAQPGNFVDGEEYKVL